MSKMKNLHSLAMCQKIFVTAGSLSKIMHLLAVCQKLFLSSHDIKSHKLTNMQRFEIIKNVLNMILYKYKIQMRYVLLSSSFLCGGS